MINVGQIPDIPGDMGMLHAGASGISTVSTKFPDTGSRIHSTWQGLSPHYLAPESAQLLAATGPIPTVTASVGEDLGTVAGALHTYADEVAAIQVRLDTLRASATDFNTNVVGADPDEWRKDEDDVNRHNQILGDINAAVADFMAAQRRCANTILALYSAKRYVEENGDGTTADNEFGYTAEQLNGALEHEKGLPWGTAEEHDRGALGDIGAFFGGVATGFVDMVKGLGALIGYGEDGWSWANAGNAWKGLGLFALSTSLPLVILNTHTDLPGIPKGTLGNTLLNAGKSIIAYDTWGEDKSKAAGMTTFNVVSAIVGTKGAGAGLRGAGAAATASRFGAVVKVGAGMVRAGEFIGRIPTVSEVALGTINKIRGFQLPPINLPDAGVNPTHVDPPRVDVPDTPAPSRSVGDALPPAATITPDGVVDGRRFTPDTPPVPQGPPIRDGVIGGRATPDVPATPGTPDAPGTPNTPGTPDLPRADAPTGPPIRDGVIGGRATPDTPTVPDSPLMRDGVIGGRAIPDTDLPPTGRADAPDAPLGDRTPGNGTPGDGIPDRTPGDLPDNGTPDRTPGDQPGDGVPDRTPEDAPGDRTPGDELPGDGTPDDSTPGDVTPDGTTPGDTTPGDGTPGDGTPADGNAGFPPGVHPPLLREDPLPTKPVKEEYLGENSGDPDAPFGGGVQYFTPAESEAFRVVVGSDGRLYSAADGSLFDTTDARTLFSDEQPRGIYVMDEHGNLYVSPFQERGVIHHSSLLAGRSVVGAGEIGVVNGVPKFINRRSGHYEPGPERFETVQRALAEQGLDLTDVELGAGF